MTEIDLSLKIISKALWFSALKHRKQKRKDKDRSPYLNHPIQVMNVLCNEGDVYDPIILVSAILHDTVEDTETTFEEIEKEFGIEIRTIIQEVTDDTTLSREERKKMQVKKASEKSSQAKQVKIADKISNIRDTVNFPPPDWDIKRKLEYIQWGKKVVSGMKGVNDKLEKVFYQTCQWAERNISD